eukprot:CCRYP_015181-RA/>CCRYP_015181-RA protein AED:0.34 eAED:0.34 QI:0/0.5/0.33/1/0.5/0.66/3/89/238
MRASSLSILSLLAATAAGFSPPPPLARIHGSSRTSLSMALTLYGSPGSRSPLVNWAALELKLPVQAGDLSKNPHPFGQIPCLTDDNDVMVFESADEKGISGDARSAAVTSWIAWANASLDPICFLETPQGKVYDTGLRNSNRRIDRLDQLLAKSKFLVPGGFSLADVAVASYLLYVIQFFPDVDLYSKWPNVVKYMKECAGREDYGKAFGENVQEFCLQRLGEMEKGPGKEKKIFGMF